MRWTGLWIWIPELVARIKSGYDSCAPFQDFWESNKPENRYEVRKSPSS